MRENKQFSCSLTNIGVGTKCPIAMWLCFEQPIFFFFKYWFYFWIQGLQAAFLVLCIMLLPTSDHIVPTSVCFHSVPPVATPVQVFNLPDCSFGVKNSRYGSVFKNHFILSWTCFLSKLWRFCTELDTSTLTLWTFCEKISPTNSLDMIKIQVTRKWTSVTWVRNLRTLVNILRPSKTPVRVLFTN